MTIPSRQPDRSSGSTGGLLRHDVVQWAYLVPDLFTAARQLNQLLGVGPFVVIEHIPLAECLYRGRPGVLDHSSAYVQCGTFMIELAQQHSTEPSAFSDMYAPGEQGLHHAAIFAPDIEAELARLEQLGFEVATLATTTAGVRFAYVDTRSALGHMLEVYEPVPALRQFYERVATLSRDWTGSPLWIDVRTAFSS